MTPDDHLETMRKKMALSILDKSQFLLESHLCMAKAIEDREKPVWTASHVTALLGMIQSDLQTAINQVKNMGLSPHICCRQHT